MDPSLSLSCWCFFIYNSGEEYYREEYKSVCYYVTQVFFTLFNSTLKFIIVLLSLQLYWDWKVLKDSWRILKSNYWYKTQFPWNKSKHSKFLFSSFQDYNICEIYFWWLCFLLHESLFIISIVPLFIFIHQISTLFNPHFFLPLLWTKSSDQHVSKIW